MSLFTTAFLMVIAVLIVLGSGIDVGTGLALIGIIGFKYFFSGSEAIIGVNLYNSCASFILAAVPLFVFMGEIVMRTGIVKALYRGVSKWLSPFPGGLLHSNIFASSIFAAISGSSSATTATIGSIAFSEEQKRKYPLNITLGSLAAGGTIGILIPPSITMIIYGAMTGVSVGKLFVAGVIPGIIMALFFMAYIFGYSIINKDKMPETEKISIKEYFVNSLMAWKDLWPFALIIATIFIGIYGGLMTPTEAGAVSVVEAMIIAILFRKLNFKVLKESALATLKTSTMVLFILIGASLLGTFISMIKLPAQLCIAVGDAGIGRYAVLFGIIGIYIVLGCLIEACALEIITLPIVFPLLVTKLGFNSLWIGILIVILTQIALITPPVGMNLFIMYGVSGKKDMNRVISGVLPFFIIMFCIIVLFMVFPEIVTFLPDRMFSQY